MQRRDYVCTHRKSWSVTVHTFTALEYCQQAFTHCLLIHNQIVAGFRSQRGADRLCLCLSQRVHSSLTKRHWINNTRLKRRVTAYQTLNSYSTHFNLSFTYSMFINNWQITTTTMDKNNNNIIWNKHFFTWFTSIRQHCDPNPKEGVILFANDCLTVIYPFFYMAYQKVHKKIAKYCLNLH